MYYGLKNVLIIQVALLSLALDVRERTADKGVVKGCAALKAKGQGLRPHTPRVLGALRHA